MFRTAVLLPFSVASVLAAFAVPHPGQRYTVVASASTATVAAAAAQAVTVHEPAMQCETKVQCERMDACTMAQPGAAWLYTVAGLPPTDAPPADAAVDTTALGVRGLAFVVHPHRDLKNLSRQQVAGLLDGSISNWSQLCGPDVEIRVLRSTDPDDQDTLSRWLGMPIQTPMNHSDSFYGDQRSQRLVTGDPFAIGTMSIDTAERAIAAGVPLQIVAIDGVEASTATVQDGSYPLVRTLEVRFADLDDSRNDRLLHHLAGLEGRALLQASGYRPLLHR
ncbi:MAG: substrate-binding domain-containing protein [Planctomycetota bacterium]